MPSYNKLLPFLVVLSIFCVSATYAQNSNTTDYTGTIRKYDIHFDGIGPEVYFLPPPPTKAEIVSALYEEKEVESVVVQEYLNTIKYVNRIQEIGNTPDRIKALEAQLTDKTSMEGLILAEIIQQTNAGNPEVAANLKNTLAKQYLAAGIAKEAIALFEEALDIKQNQANTNDIDVVTHNLAVSYEYLQDLGRAKTLHQEIYQRALSSKNANKQASSLMNLALVKAKLGQYKEAENDIIRKVLPAFKRVDNHQGRIAAYHTLAEVYTIQNKYPEAQWFLLQAKEIATNKRLDAQMAEIIFNLAETKKRSGNNLVAIEEYKTANNLAEEGNHLSMQLAIQDALGDLYNTTGNVDMAATTLGNYETLKSRLLKSTVSADND